VVGGIICGLQKAFDCVNHNILLTKSEFYGITGTILKLINKSYLEGRYQNVILDNNLHNCNANWGEIMHGNADNTSIIITSPNPTDFTNSANKILQDINKWFTANLLSLNADKTQYVRNLN
jgi:hypothetical protein